MIINIKVNTINHTQMSNDKIIFIDINCSYMFWSSSSHLHGIFLCELVIM